MKRAFTISFYLILTLLYFIKNAYCQGMEIPKEYYTAAGIPDSLKESANSVIRYAIEEDEVSSSGKMTEKHHNVITILNEKGDNEAIMAMGYSSKYDSFSDITMRVYDETGKMIKKYRRSDMYDGLAIDNVTLVTDYRFLELKHTIANYPTTVEIEYERTTTNIMGLGEWLIQKKSAICSAFIFPHGYRCKCRF